MDPEKQEQLPKDQPEASTQVKSTKKAINWRKRIQVVGIITLSVLVVFGTVGFLYLDSLANLVQYGDVAGDPNYNPSNETQDPDDLVLPSTKWTLDPSMSLDGPTDPTTLESSQTTLVPSVTPKPTATPKPTPTPLPPLPIPTSSSVYNILLIGTDNRGNEVNGRSDSMIILSVNTRTRKIHLASLMRGMYVQIPGHGWGMLNASFSYGGSRLLLSTIELNFRVRINDFLLINFGDFVQAIDRLGGVDITLTSAEEQYLQTRYPSLNLVVGSNLLAGKVALAYSRIRKIDSDYARTARQRKVILALIKKARLLNVGELDATARYILPLVRTNLTGSKIVSKVVGSLAYRSYPVSQLMLPIPRTYQTIYVHGAQMVQTNLRRNAQALQDLLYHD
jgi:LCP family protein required for cell wall assembly